MSEKLSAEEEARIVRPEQWRRSFENMIQFWDFDDAPPHYQTLIDFECGVVIWIPPAKIDSNLHLTLRKLGALEFIVNGGTLIFTKKEVYGDLSNLGHALSS